jgi:ribosomal protein S18 acetylase RimI-like enzyme
VQRPLPDGFELDDDPDRIQLDAVHAFLSGEAYWAVGRPRETIERLVREASRVVGLYRDGAQVGFSRTVSDGMSFAYLADVYVLAELRGRGLGEALVRFTVDEGPFSDRRWLLHTSSAGRLYARVGFGPGTPTLMERPPPGR